MYKLVDAHQAQLNARNLRKLQADEYIDRIAKALCEAGHHAWPATDGYNDRAEKDAFRRMAIAAIKVMANPPDFMLEDGDYALINGHGTRTIFNMMLHFAHEQPKFERSTEPREVRLPRKGISIG